MRRRRGPPSLSWGLCPQPRLSSEILPLFSLSLVIYNLCHLQRTLGCVTAPTAATFNVFLAYTEIFGNSSGVTFKDSHSGPPPPHMPEISEHKSPRGPFSTRSPSKSHRPWPKRSPLCGFTQVPSCTKEMPSPRPQVKRTAQSEH